MEAFKKILIGMMIVALLVAAFFGIWYFFFRSGSPVVPNSNTTTIKNTQSFGTGQKNTGETPLTNQPIDTSAATPDQKIFKIADGPIITAIFIQTKNPTTTLARYVKQDSGHVFDIPVNIPGAISRVVSNTTIPGIATGLWLSTGSSTILQYEENKVIKTLSLGFTPPKVGSSTAPYSQIHFFPNNITDIAASPDGRFVAYLLAVPGGSVGFVSNPDGSGAKKLFSMPFSQLLLSWPSANMLLVQTKEAAGVPGMAFAVSTRGVITPLVYGLGLSAAANVTFSKVVYQATPQGRSLRQTYIHDVQRGKDSVLPFNPLPEKCVWSRTASSTMYCAAPLEATPSNYLDSWHQGVTNYADSLLAFDVRTNVTSLLAQPGGVQGGVSGEIAQMALSPDGQYALFITRGDRTLWGVHIGH